ncbi:DegT/DnrJ/EryC1/StrS family aminotransferase [Aequorivita marina]|uniref:DegT/DnrJ/EryC1/StrS family aminotransferase n=1 Tax=Aequorivita marina TaxID=3073654 RepID=UPI0028746B70|nr:DegT/DnrJ/EryC1/StrS family aminotransferase [Aequorivita sp. S2608]MDS1299075.1 DegT/DnrJ/EryC1/StrS family aminotransferase [Aequorivita sp. S2608]
MIPVTKPFLPPKEKYEKYLDKIWESQWLTNMGPLANELEDRLCKHLNVADLLFVTNGTIALQMAIKALGLKDEIITTPFSFIATTSSIVWENCKPVFVDIDQDSLNIDPTKIEAAITDKTTAILATHVYGNPCDVLAIEKIAKKHNLKVIYDGAHAFGLQVGGQSIFNYGDISICSLHATKLYHSGEGGFMVAKDEAIHKKLKSIRNFGFAGPESFSELGINGKNSEFHAAMGLVNLNYIQPIHNKRKQLAEAYDEGLKNFPHKTPKWHNSATKNYAYYPILFENEAMLLKTKKRLEEEQVLTRRYFYPSLAKVLPYLPENEMPITESLAKRVLCLPFYYDLKIADAQRICQLIQEGVI